MKPPRASDTEADTVELFAPDRIHLNETTEALLGDVRETARKVNELRPLSPDIVRDVQARLLGERVYSSNAIEGNTCDLRETLEILRTGHVDIARKREATEVINLGNAIRYTQDALLPDPNPHTPEKLLEAHRNLQAGIDDEWAGKYRERGVMISGAKYQPPDHGYVPALVRRLLEQIAERENRQDVDPVLLATWGHWAIARIHPFVDGNGRIARLWQDLVLFRARLSCAIIRPEDRREYVNSLQAADDADFNPLTQLVARRVVVTLRLYLHARRAEQGVADWAAQAARETIARDPKTTIGELREMFARFVAERNWEQFHDPKNLASSIAIEAAELMEHFQWVRSDELDAIRHDPQQMADIREELADVMAFVLAFANAMDIDIASAVEDKMAKNARKYPADRYYGRFKA